MDMKSAKRIGRLYTTIAVFIALIIVYLMVIGMTGDSLWLLSERKNLPNFIGGAVFVILAGFFIGAYTGSSILIRNKNAYWISIRNSFFILWAGTLLGACIGFFEEGIHDPFGIISGLDNYIIKPLLLITIFGCIPTTIIALILGWTIKRNRDDKKSK